MARAPSKWSSLYGRLLEAEVGEANFEGLLSELDRLVRSRGGLTLSLYVGLLNLFEQLIGGAQNVTHN